MKTFPKMITLTINKSLQQKRSNELMAHTYSHLYNLPTTGLKFYRRPDMALFLFTKLFKKINVFWKMIRDFTFVDDVSESFTD